jgi:hypothetical protein
MFALYAPNIYIFIFCINIIYESYLQIFLYLCTTFESPNLKEKERRTFYFLEEEMPQIVSLVVYLVSLEIASFVEGTYVVCKHVGTSCISRVCSPIHYYRNYWQV